MSSTFPGGDLPPPLRRGSFCGALGLDGDQVGGDSRLNFGQVLSTYLLTTTTTIANRMVLFAWATHRGRSFEKAPGKFTCGTYKVDSHEETLYLPCINFQAYFFSVLLLATLVAYLDLISVGWAASRDLPISTTLLVKN